MSEVFNRYWTAERLLEHLPELYRQRDAELARELGLPSELGPLRGLLNVVAAEFGEVEAELDQVYENWFVETCAPWLLPYVAELLGIDSLPNSNSADVTARAFIANMLEYRAGKGTPRVLAQMSADASGWHTNVVEYFRQIVRTHHANRFRPGEILSPDIHALIPLERIEHPLGQQYHLPDVHRISSRHRVGKYNLPSVGVHVWPLRAYSWPSDAQPVARYAVQALAVRFNGEPAIRRWSLHPFGVQFPLFNEPAHAHSPHDPRAVPETLSALALHNELDRLRQSRARAQTDPQLEYFGADRPVLRLYTGETLDPIPPEQIQIADFSLGWPQPLPARSYPDGNGAEVDLPIRAALDPITGQVAFAPGTEPTRLVAEFAYGASTDIGGGPYDRRDRLSFEAEDVDWQAGVSRVIVDPGNVFSTLESAIQEWHLQPAGTFGVICIMDNLRHVLNQPLQINISPGSRLVIVAADWPLMVQSGLVVQRLAGVVAPVGLRANIVGSIRIVGTAAVSDENPGSIEFSGLYVGADLSVEAGFLGNLELSDGTVTGQLNIQGQVGGSNANLKCRLARCVVTSITSTVEIDKLEITDCILGDAGDSAIASIQADTTPAEIIATTLWGPVTVKELDATDVLFTESVTSVRTQVGCVRYSYVAPNSRTPRRFRCQPDLALEDAAPTEQDAIRQRMTPVFASREPGRPDYARLAPANEVGITQGGELGRSMGVHAGLDEPNRAQFTLRNAREFARAGMETNLITESTRPIVRYGRNDS